MCIGEKRKLWCHPSIAYGEHGIGPIPPNAALIFETELVDIAGVKKEEEEEKEVKKAKEDVNGDDEEIERDEL